MALHKNHRPQTNLLKRKRKPPETKYLHQNQTTASLTLLQPRNSTPPWTNFLALLKKTHWQPRMMHCYPPSPPPLTVQLNCHPCSLLSSLLKFKQSVTSFTRHLSSRALLAHLAPDHHCCFWNKKSMSFRSCERNTIPASLFSDCLPYLLPAIVNTSLCTGSFPIAFKTASVRPLQKKQQLWPKWLKTIALSLTFREKFVLQQLNHHLSNNK